MKLTTHGANKQQLSSADFRHSSLVYLAVSLVDATTLLTGNKELQKAPPLDVGFFFQR